MRSVKKKQGGGITELNGKDCKNCIVGPDGNIEWDQTNPFLSFFLSLLDSFSLSLLSRFEWN